MPNLTFNTRFELSFPANVSVHRLFISPSRHLMNSAASSWLRWSHVLLLAKRLCKQILSKFILTSYREYACAACSSACSRESNGDKLDTLPMLDTDIDHYITLRHGLRRPQSRRLPCRVYTKDFLRPDQRLLPFFESPGLRPIAFLSRA